MDVARDVIELFSVKDPARARELAAKLDRLNTDRQEEERRILRAVEERFTGDPTLCDAYCIVVDGEGWHRGVIGITATRIVERYNRPALVISRDGAEAFGSGRSIRAFHLLEAIESCSTLFSRYGGHSHACGFAMPSANVADLRAKSRRLCPNPSHPRGFRSDSRSGRGTGSGRNHARAFPSAPTCSNPTAWAIPSPYSLRAARSWPRLPRILKDKHVKLKVRAGVEFDGNSPRPPSSPPHVAIPTAPQSGQKKRPLP